MDQTICNKKYNLTVFLQAGLWKHRKMLKDDFEMKLNQKNEEWYVIKVYELSRNHRKTESIMSGIMPEIGMTLCSPSAPSKNICCLHTNMIQ